MPIAFINSSGAIGSGESISIPSGAIQGDLLIIITTGPGIPTPPADWTLLASQNAAQNITVYYKFFSGSTASVSMTTGATRTYMLAYSGVAATDSISAFTTVTGTSLGTGTLTTASVDEYVLSIYASSSGTTSSWTAPASTNVRASNGSTSTVGGLLVVDELQAAAGVSTARTATVSASRALSAVQISITANDRFWVGGSGTWDNSSTTNWSYTSGGASGAPAPTVNDIANFDANSGTAATVTVASTAVALATNIDKPDINLTLSGNATLAGSGSAGNLFSFYTGTIDLSGFTLSVGIFSSLTSDNRTVSFGSGSIALTSTVTAPFTPRVLDMPFLTNFTPTGTGGFTRNQAATSFIVCGTGGGGSATTAPNFTINAGASTVEFSTSANLKTLNFTGSTCSAQGTARLYGDLTLASGGTYTNLTARFLAAATVTSNGKTLNDVSFDSAGATLTLADALTLGITRTFTLTQGTISLAGFTLSTGAFVSNNTNTRAISFGSGNIALTSTTGFAVVLGIANATGFTWTGTGGFTRNITVNTIFDFGVTGGTVTNAINLSITAGSASSIIGSGSWFNNLSFAGNSSFLSSTTLNMCGNLTLGSATSYSSLTISYKDSGSIICNGKALGQVDIYATGGTVAFADAFSSSSINLYEGTLDFSGFAVTAGIIRLASATTDRSLLMGASTVTVTATASPWQAEPPTGLTLNAGTSTINLTLATAKTFIGGGLTYYNINQAGAGELTINGSNTFNNITTSVLPATVRFTAGSTQTVSNFGLSGTSGNLVTINSSTLSSQFTLSKVSGVVNAQYLNIQDSNATGGATWNASFSTDNGNNTGWNISAGAATSFFVMF
jgi:hypothetical protein